MASIKKRGNSYTITVSLGRKADGSPLQKSCTYKPDLSKLTKKTTAAREKELQAMIEAFADDYEKRVKNGEVLDGENLRFSEVVNRWKNDSSFKKLSIRVQEDYTRILEKRVLNKLGHLAISKISKVMIMDIINGMVDDGYAPGTVRTTFVVIKSVFDYAEDMELISKNPCDKLNKKLPSKKKKTGIRCFDVNQAKTFLRVLKEGYEITYSAHDTVIKATGKIKHISEYTELRTVPLQLQCFYNLAIYGGFRKGELLALTWHDIDFENCSINIEKSVSDTKELGAIVKDPKTVSGIRKLTLPKECFRMLAKWKLQQKGIAKDLGSAWQGSPIYAFDDNRLFIQDSGKPMDVGTPYQRFKDILTCYNKSVDKRAQAAATPEERQRIEAEKLPDITLHELRHTQASFLYANNVPLATISKRMGHSRVSTTADIYVHSLDSMDSVAADALERMLG